MVHQVHQRLKVPTLNIKATNVAISTDMLVVVTVTDTLETQAVGLGTTNVAVDAGISTAAGTVIYDADVGMQVYSGDAGGWKTIADTSGPPPDVNNFGDVVMVISIVLEILP